MMLLPGVVGPWLGQPVPRLASPTPGCPNRQRGSAGCAGGDGIPGDPGRFWTVIGEVAASSAGSPRLGDGAFPTSGEAERDDTTLAHVPGRG